MIQQSLSTTPRNERPILLLGAPRSGTSLLSRVIGAHPRIAVPFESHIFAQWVPRVAEYGDLEQEENRRALVEDIISYGVVRDWTPRPVASEVIALIRENTFGGVTRAFMDWWATQEGKPRWGEKTPWHLLLHQDVLKAWPDVLVVLIHRDPRDTSLSWKEARFHGKHVQRFAESWLKHQKAAHELMQRIPREDWLVTAYEDLVSDTEGELCRIMHFLGEIYDPVQLQFHRNEVAYGTDVRNEDQLRKPISTKSIGRWRTGLSSREVRLIEAVAGDEMRRLGYEPMLDRSQVPDWERAYMRYVEQPLTRLPDLVRNRQGYVYIGRDMAYRIHRLRKGKPYLATRA